MVDKDFYGLEYIYLTLGKVLWTKAKKGDSDSQIVLLKIISIFFL